MDPECGQMRSKPNGVENLQQRNLIKVLLRSSPDPQQLVSWSLTSIFSTNMAISETMTLNTEPA